MTERMMMLAIQLGLILFLARLGHMLFERLRLPGVLGEVVAGILMGPYVIGSIGFYGFPDGLFPPGDGFPVSPELYGLCAVAAVLLLFVVGLETDLRLLRHYTVAGVLVGVGGVAVSFLAGALVTQAFSGVVFGKMLGLLAPECLLLGVIATATSVGITARILSEKRKTDTPEGVTILAGAVIDDVLGIILLAVVLGVITASRGTGSVDWAHIGVIAGKAVGIWLVATAIGLTASRKLSFLLKLFRDRSSIALMALGLALILASLFEHAGLAMIVGAYVVGLSLSPTDITHVIREKLDPIFRFLVPVFFCVMGMLIDVRTLFTGQVLMFGAAYTAVAMLAKVAGCGLPTMLAGFNLRGALRVGAGMMPRCEVALTIAGIALAKGALTHEIVGIPVLLMMVTTLVTPPVLVALFRSDAPGTRRALERTDEKTAEFPFPSPEIADLMASKLLSVFESEGFFVHLVDRTRQIYQLRKDEMIIGLRCEGARLAFSGGGKGMDIVNAAMYEVVAELERTIAGLRQPVDAKAIAQRVLGEMEIPRAEEGLARFLDIGALLPKLKGATKEAVIEDLLRTLDRRGLLDALDDAREAVWERERSMSTGMQHGIAIPHGRTDAVKRLVCAVGLHKKGVDFDSLDGEPAHIIVLALSPKSAAAPHMQFMSMMGHALSGNGREELLACRTARAMYAVLTGGPEGTSGS
jgi:Kef-type K+ transport system membrane component KefB/mannitol/fructose-specific phosphotransferase system IIA component (Ntr-type)